MLWHIFAGLTLFGVITSASSEDNCIAVCKECASQVDQVIAPIVYDQCCDGEDILRECTSCVGSDESCDEALSKRGRGIIGRELEKRPRGFIGRELIEKRPRGFIGRELDDETEPVALLQVGQKRRTWLGKRRTWIGKRRTWLGKRRTWLGKRRTWLGKRRTWLGKRRTWLGR